MPGPEWRSRSLAPRHEPEGNGRDRSAAFSLSPAFLAMVLTAGLLGPVGPSDAQETPPLRGPLDASALSDTPLSAPSAQAPRVPSAANGQGAPPPLPEEAPGTEITPPRIPTPEGIPAGAFRLRTEVTAEMLATDNVRQTETNRKADIGERLSARLALESNWPRHTLRGSLEVDETAWQETGLDDLSVGARIESRLDLAAGQAASLAAGWRLAPEADGPERLTHALSAEAGWQATGGILRPSFGIGVTRMIYTNRTSSGDPVSTGDDDYTEPSLRLAVTMDRGGRLRPFVAGSYSWRRHDRQRNAAGISRDSRGGAVETGIELDDAIWSGRLALRYAARKYDDPATGTVKGFGVDAALTWRPDRLLVIDMNAGFGIDDTAVAGAAAVRRYTGRIRATRQLRENLSLQAGLAAEYADYAASPDHEFTLRGDITTEWRLNRYLSLLAGWRIERQWSTLPNADYLENRLRLGLRHRF